MTRKRKIAKLVGPEKFEIDEEPLKSPGDDELLIRIVSCGLCHSELPHFLGDFIGVFNLDGSVNMMEGENIEYPISPPTLSHFGYFMGHEPVGIVEEVGKNITEFKIGDYVTGPKPGSFASHIIADTYLLSKLPGDINNPENCLGELLMCISNIVRTANPEFGDKLAIIGCGSMGLLALSVLAKSSAFEVIAIDLEESRLNWAAKLGATKTINPNQVELMEVISEITQDKGVDIAIDTTGRVAGFNTACKIIKECRGKILIPSYYANPEPMRAGHDLANKAPVIHSVHPDYSLDYMKDMKRGIEGYKRDILRLNDIITHEFSLEKINEAFEMLQNPDSDYIKGVIKPV